jgi:membrane-associated phospholipid phosphatase
VRAAGAFVSASEVVSLMTISKWALGGALVLAGLIALALRSAAAAPLLLVGATHLVARLVAGVLKNVFGRLRPLEGDAWFAGGGAMPSGHAIHWWSLYAALVFFFPRLRWWLLPVPVAISLARVLVNDHWVSDTIASAALAALIVAASAKIRIGSGSAPARRP